MYSRFTGFFCKGDEGRSERGTVRLHLFFFFFFFEFRPDSAVSAVSADTGRFGRYRPIRPIRPSRRRFPPNRRRLQPRRPASARFRTCHVAQRGPTRHGRAVCGVPAASPCPAASDAGALAWEPRPCIPDDRQPMPTSYT